MYPLTLTWNLKTTQTFYPVCFWRWLPCGQLSCCIKHVKEQSCEESSEGLWRILQLNLWMCTDLEKWAEAWSSLVNVSVWKQTLRPCNYLQLSSCSNNIASYIVTVIAVFAYNMLVAAENLISVILVVFLLLWILVMNIDACDYLRLIILLLSYFIIFIYMFTF